MLGNIVLQNVQWIFVTIWFKLKVKTKAFYNCTITNLAAFEFVKSHHWPSTYKRVLKIPATYIWLNKYDVHPYQRVLYDCFESKLPESLYESNDTKDMCLIYCLFSYHKIGCLYVLNQVEIKYIYIMRGKFKLIVTERKIIVKMYHIDNVIFNAEYFIY